MRIIVKAKPNSREEKIERISENEFAVFVKEPPVRGLANRAIIDALASYFNIPSSFIKIISGRASKRKLLEIPDSPYHYQTLKNWNF